jgi:hypothetical protein
MGDSISFLMEKPTNIEKSGSIGQNNRKWSERRQGNLVENPTYSRQLV